MLDEIGAPPAAAALARGDVVGGETAADDELGQDGDEIILVPVLVGVAEDEIERARQGGDELVGVGEAGVDEGVEPGFPEVGQRFAVTALVDVHGDELAARLAQGPGDPDPRMPGGRPDLEGPGVLVLDDEVVEDLAVGFGDVHVPPLPGVIVEKGLDLPVEGLSGLARRVRGRSKPPSSD